MSAESYRILVADDEPTLLDAYRTVLNDITPTADADSAISRLEAKLFGPKAQTGSLPTFTPVLCRSGERAVEMLREMLRAGQACPVAFLDVRMPPVAGYPASLADINYAIRWLKARAGELKSRVDRVGLLGVSSGAHQAMLSAMRPRDQRYAAIPLPRHPELDATVAAVVLVWPVIDPLRRFHHAKRLQAAGGKYPEQIDRVIPLHIKFWQTEAAMEEGNPVGILDRDEAVEMPPVLYVQGGNDIVHPRVDLERFVASYRKRGGEVDLALYEGEAEGFIRNPASKAAPQALQRIIDFVHAQLR